MANIWADNFQYEGKKPDFTRQEYATKADMKAVKKVKMPEMYIGYCLEDRKIYVYNKANEDDEVLGYWRELKGGGDSIQVSAMPTAVEQFDNKVVQYIGTTEGGYTKGYFYICGPSGTETVAVETLARLTELINASSETVSVQLADESIVSAKTFAFGGENYFINEEVIYCGTVADDKIILANATAITTDEGVVAKNITEEVITGWAWENLSVSPSAGEPLAISTEEIDELFD